MIDCPTTSASLSHPIWEDSLHPPLLYFLFLSPLRSLLLCLLHLPLSSHPNSGHHRSQLSAGRLRRLSSHELWTTHFVLPPRTGSYLGLTQIWSVAWTRTSITLCFFHNPPHGWMPCTTTRWTRSRPPIPTPPLLPPWLQPHLRLPFATL